MIDEYVALAVSVATGIFGAGTAYAGMRNGVRVAQERAATAIQQADTMIGRLAEMKTVLAELKGRIDVHEERIGNIREKADEMVTSKEFRAEMRAQTRTLSERGMIAIRPGERREEPSDPPPMRPRLPSRREG